MQHSRGFQPTSRRGSGQPSTPVKRCKTPLSQRGGRAERMGTPRTAVLPVAKPPPADEPTPPEPRPLPHPPRTLGCGPPEPPPALPKGGARQTRQPEPGGPPRHGRVAVLAHTFRADVRCGCPAGGSAWVAERSGSVSLRDAVSGCPESAVLKRPGLLVNCVLPVGAAVWAGCGDGMIRVFEAGTGAVAGELGRHPGGVLCLCVSQGGFVYSGGSDWKITKWNPDSLKGCGTLSGHSGSVRCVAAPPASSSVALYSGSDDGTIRCWSQGRDPVALRLSGAVLALLLDGDRLWSGGDDRCIRVWDVSSGQCIRTFEEHGSSVVSLQQPTEAGPIWSAAKDGSVALWHPSTLTKVQQVADKGDSRLVWLGAVGRVAGTLVWGADADGAVRCWVAQDDAAEPPAAETGQSEQQLEDMSAAATRLQQQLEVKESERFKQVEKTLELQSALEVSRQQSDTAEEEVKRVRSDHASLDKRLKQVTAERDHLAARGQELDGEAALLRAQVAELRALRSEAAAQEDVTSLVERAARLRSGSGDVDTRRLQDEIQVLKGDIAVRDGNLMDTRARLDDALRQLSSLRQAASGTHGEMLRQDARAAEARNALADAERACEMERAAKEELARLYDAQEVSFQERVGHLRREHQEALRERRLAEQDRDALRQEVRRLGELLAEVSAKAKEYQSRSAVLSERMTREVTADREELEARARAAERQADGLTAENNRLARDLEAAHRDIAGARVEAHEADARRAARLKAEWDSEREELQQKILALEATEAQRAGDWETPKQRKLKEALAETQQALREIEARCGDGPAQLEAKLAEKDEKLAKAETEVKRLRQLFSGCTDAGDPIPGDTGMQAALYTQLQHSTLLNQELQRQNTALEETATQLKNQMLLMGSANRRLQKDADTLRVEAGADAAKTDDDPPPEPATDTPAVEYVCPMVSPPELRGAAPLAGRPPSPSYRIHNIDRMNRELDGIVDYIHGMKGKLEHLEESAAGAKDTHLREALLQQMNALHRQALDDSVTVRSQVKPERKKLEPLPATEGGILKLASQRFSEVETELGLKKSALPQPRGLSEDGAGGASPSQLRSRSASSPVAASPKGAMGTEIGGVRHEVPPTTAIPTYDSSITPSLIRRAFSASDAASSRGALFAP